jgi:hypothetical protein
LFVLFACLIALPASFAHAKGRPGGGGGGGGAGVALTSEAVVPGPGEMGASGNAVISVGHGTVCFTITVDGLSDKITEIALYKAPAGQAGPKVLRLTPSPIGLYQLNDCVPADAALVRDITRNASAYYVQINTQLHSNGALRGQLH